jgi:hypothetical protein
MDSFNNTSDSRPEHHVHSQEEPLPGARGAHATYDYSPENLDRTPSSAFTSGGGALATGGGLTSDSHHEHTETGLQQPSTGGQNAFNSERPLDVEPTTQGGVAIGGDEARDLPQGKASFMDKIVGKTEKVRSTECLASLIMITDDVLFPVGVRKSNEECGAA